MKIAYHHRTFADGAEGIHIAEMVEAFEALGHRVVMMSLARPRARGEGHVGFLSRVRRRLPPSLFEVAAATYSLVDFATFTWRLGREQPDLLYKRHAMNDVGVLAAAALCRVPAVLEVNCPYSSPQHREFEHVRLAGLATWCERRALALAALVITVSTPLRTYLLSIGARPEDTLVVPNGANPERFTPTSEQVRSEMRARLGLTGFVVGWVGILRQWHGLDLLVEAAAHLPEATFLIIGDGPDKEPLESLISQRGLRDRVLLTGRVPSEEMSRYLAAMDLAVASADRTGYASPMKILEYMAAGLPTVAPKLTNIEDIITHGEHGLLFVPGDPHALAAAVRALINAPAEARRMGRLARLSVERERNWQAIALHVLEEAGNRR